MIRILIVEDHPIFRMGMEEMINQECDMTICGHAEDVPGAGKLIERERPDLVIVDLSLKEFNRIYKLLGVRIDYAYSESFYLNKMGEVLEDCRQKGILKESQGAQVVEIPVNGDAKISVAGKGEAIAQVVRRYNLPQADKAKDDILKVDVSYDVTDVAVNDLVKVSAQVTFNPP